MMRTFSLSGLVVLVSLLSASLSWGHGGKPSPRAFYMDPHQPEVQAVVSSDQGIDISLDGGNSWQWVCEDVIGFDVFAFALAGDPEKPPEERVWLAGSNGIEEVDGEQEEDGKLLPGFYRSTDAGCNWEPVGGILADQWVRHILVNPRNPDHIVVGTSHKSRPNGVAFSTDAGETWQWSDLVELDGIIHQMIRAPSNPDVLYASWKNEIFRSNDGGRTWKVLFENADPKPMPDEIDRAERFYVNPEDPDDLWFGSLITSTVAIFRTQDGGVSYTNVGFPDADLSAFHLVDSPEGEVMVVGTAWGDFYRAWGPGETWEVVEFTYPIDCFVSDPNDSSHFFFCQNLGFRPPGIDANLEFFAIGHSQDLLATVEPYFRYADRQRLSCPEDSQIYEICVPLEGLLDNNGSLDGPGTGWPGEEPGDKTPDDGNADLDGEENQGDCDCSVGGKKRAGGRAWWLVLGVLGILWRRRSSLA